MDRTEVERPEVEKRERQGEARIPFEYEAFGLIAPALEPPPIPGGGPQTVADVLSRPVREAPDREALVGRHGRFSFRELDREVQRAAVALRSHGVRQGDRVAACLPNDCDIVVAFLAVTRIGALWVGVNRVLAAKEKQTVLSDCGARLLLATREVAEEIGGVAPSSLEVIRVAPGAASEWHALLEASDPADFVPASLRPTDPAAIAYTSGTTGKPKGAVHSHRNLLLVGAVAVEYAQFPPGLRHGAVLPLTILNLIVLAPLVAYQLGSACVAIDRIDPVGLAGWVERERVGHFAGVPTIFHDLLTHPEVRREQLATLLRPEVGGAECPEEFRKLYRERFGGEVTIGYGMTEAPTVVTRSTGELSAVAGYCGSSVPQLRVVVRDEEDRPLSAGEIGEICVEPQREGKWAGVYTPMLGYWKRPEASAEALRGGAYHTGDLGFLDGDGSLFIRGRRNELILRGGANVYPAEVERVLLSHAGVAAAAVLGLADARLGERVVAAVQCEAGAHPSSEELLALCRRELARYKAPELLRFVDSMPRNAMGKIVKRQLLPLFAEATA